MKVIKEKPRRRQYPFPNITESRCRWKSGISRRKEKITPELPAEGLSRPGRISCVKGTHMMVCSNRWLNGAVFTASVLFGTEAFFASWKDIQSFSHTRIEIYHEWNGGRRYV